MRDYIADRLLWVSSALHVASVWCKDAALWVLTLGRRGARR